MVDCGKEFWNAVVEIREISIFIRARLILSYLAILIQLKAV